MEELLKEIQKELVEIRLVLERNTASLEVHEKRTDLAERRIEDLQSSDRRHELELASLKGSFKGALFVGSIIGAFLLTFNWQEILGKLF